MNSKILIIEDEEAIQNILMELLKDAGYTVVVASDGVEGLNLFNREAPDLVLLDILMPKIDGYSVCRRIREKSDVPIIMITALDSESSQIKGFDLQADDYITKPFFLPLVLKRVEAMLRRNKKEGDSDQCLSYQSVELWTQSREVYVGERKIDLTNIEYEILKMLLNNRGRVFSRQDLINFVWGNDFYGDEKGVNFHIMNLRRKLSVPCIQTVRGVGYKIEK